MNFPLTPPTAFTTTPSVLAPTTSPFSGAGTGGDPTAMAMMGYLMSAMTQMMGLLGAQGSGAAPSGALPAMPAFGGGAPGPNGLGNFLGGGAGKARRPKRRRASGGGGGGGAMPGGGGLAPSAGGPSAGAASPSAGGAAPSAGAAAPSGSSSSAPSSGLGESGIKGLTFAKAAELVRKGGGEVNPDGKPTVLAIRKSTTATSKYDDTFVVLKPDGTLSQFAASTRPTSTGQDRAMLKPGAYEISPRWRDGKYNDDAFLVKSKSGSTNVGVGRDSNGDGQWSKQEMSANTSSDLIRLHRGNSSSTSSTGCLNVKDYDGFLKSVGGRDADFNLVVVNQ